MKNGRRFIKVGLDVTPRYLKKMIVREPRTKISRLHPKAKLIRNQMIQTPLPLTYKLQELPDPDTSLHTPLGNTHHLPFQVYIYRYKIVYSYLDTENTYRKYSRLFRFQE